MWNTKLRLVRKLNGKQKVIGYSGYMDRLRTMQDNLPPQEKIGKFVIESRSTPKSDDWTVFEVLHDDGLWYNELGQRLVFNGKMFVYQ